MNDALIPALTVMGVFAVRSRPMRVADYVMSRDSNIVLSQPDGLGLGRVCMAWRIARRNPEASRREIGNPTEKDWTSRRSIDRLPARVSL